MALITSENFDAVMAALSTASMVGYALVDKSETIREGMEQLMPNGEWWFLDYRIESLGPVTSNELPQAIAFRKKV